MACAAMGVFGIAAYLAYARYKLIVRPEGFTVERLARRPLTAAWRDIAKVRENVKAITFITSDGRRISIPTEFPHLDAFLTTAAQNLPKSAYASQ